MSLPWPPLDEVAAEQRAEERFDEATAWKWVSAALIEPLGLTALDGQQDGISDEAFRREIQKRGVASLAN